MFDDPVQVAVVPRVTDFLRRRLLRWLMELLLLLESLLRRVALLTLTMLLRWRWIMRLTRWWWILRLAVAFASALGKADVHRVDFTETYLAVGNLAAGSLAG